MVRDGGPYDPDAEVPFAPEHDRIRRGPPPGRALDRHRRGALGEQPPPQAHRQDQRPVRLARARGRAARPRVGPPRDGRVHAPGRAAEAGRRLPAQHGRDPELHRAAPGPRADGRLVRPGRRALRCPASSRSGGRPSTTRTTTGRAVEGRSAMPWQRSSKSRAEEGRAMAEELLALGRSIGAELERVAARGPEVVAGYQKRLIERVAGARPRPRPGDRAEGPDPRGRHLRRAGRHRRGGHAAPAPTSSSSPR